MITVLTVDENDKWDNIVKQFDDYDIYYLSGYVKAFFVHGDGMPLLIYYSNEKLKAINVVMKRDIAEDKNFIGKIEKSTYFDIITPYGYGGWLIDGDVNDNTLAVFNNEYSNWCVDNGLP